jgi:hypothetical protein
MQQAKEPVSTAQPYMAPTSFATTGIASIPVMAAVPAYAATPTTVYGMHFPPIAATGFDSAAAAAAYAAAYNTAAIQAQQNYMMSNMFPASLMAGTPPQQQQAFNIHSTAAEMNVVGQSYDQAQDIPDSYINGAIELSAGAKPFVPKTFVPAPLAASPSNTPMNELSFTSSFISTMNVNMASSSLWSPSASTSVPISTPQSLLPTANSSKPF